MIVLSHLFLFGSFWGNLTAIPSGGSYLSVLWCSEERTKTALRSYNLLWSGLFPPNSSSPSVLPHYAIIIHCHQIFRTSARGLSPSSNPPHILDSSFHYALYTPSKAVLLLKKPSPFGSRSDSVCPRHPSVR